MIKKVCGKCTHTFDGPRCKTCLKAYMQTYMRAYQQNPKYKAAMRVYYQSHKRKILLSQKAYRASAKYRARIKTYMKTYRNTPKYKAYLKTYHNTAKYKAYRNSAKYKAYHKTWWISAKATQKTKARLKKYFRSEAYKEANRMRQWLKAKGFRITDFPEAIRPHIQAAYEAHIAIKLAKGDKKCRPNKNTPPELLARWQRLSRLPCGAC